MLQDMFLNAFLCISVGYKSRNGITQSWYTISSALVACVQKFSKVVVPVYLLSIKQCVRSVLRPCQCLVLSVFCILAFLVSMLQHYTAVLILNFPKTNEVGHYYLICFLLIKIHSDSFVKYPLKFSSHPPPPFFMGLTFF